jgi:deoxynucleoside triphosphate triphosphohydrolase SAMHD1
MAAVNGDTFRNYESLQNYAEQVWAWCDSLVDEYSASLEGSGSHIREINDPIWGTISLSPIESMILDMPLLQRLRFVKQLGVAQWVYPSAQHDRLQHSIGAMHLVSLVNSALLESGTTGLADGLFRLLRLAALCHDVGHCVMSHVAENALQATESVVDVRLDFEDWLISQNRRIASSKSPSLGEINSFLILTSKSFGELLKKAVAESGQVLFADGNGTSANELMAWLVLGEQIAEEDPFIQLLISGPFDVDKMDYMVRDAFFAGIPRIVDIGRLISKIRYENLPPSDVPEDIRGLLRGEAKTIRVLSIQESGSRTIDELILGRTLLFDKVYRHPKVRALEGTVQQWFKSLSKMGISEIEQCLIALRLRDEDLLTDDPRILRILVGAKGNGRKTADALAEACRVGKDLRNRRPLVSAYEFSIALPEDPYRGMKEHGDSLSQLIEDLGDGSEHKADIETDVLLTVKKAKELLGKPDSRTVVTIDPPRPTPGLSFLRHVQLSTKNGQYISYSKHAPETETWANAYQQTRDVGLVFSDSESKSLVSLAFETVLRARYGVRSHPSQYGKRKVERTGVDEIRQKLFLAGFYDDLPLDLLPIPEALRNAGTRQKVESISRALHGYHGPGADSSKLTENGIPMSEHVIDFVRQFAIFEADYAGISEDIVEMLSKVRLIGRDAIVGTVLDVLTADQRLHDSSIVPFGDAKDSAALNAYWAGDARRTFGNVEVRSLDEAIQLGKPIIFVDDFISSGSQASAIVSSWCGDDARAEALGERRRQLPPETITLLKRTQLVFVFAAGCDAGQEGAALLRTVLAELGFVDVTVLVGTKYPDIPRLSSFTGKQKSRLETVLSEVGANLLEPEQKKIDGWTQEKLDSRVLGYGNEGFLLTFPYNTPTQALTALWRSGNVRGRRWTPLLPRRTKS